MSTSTSETSVKSLDEILDASAATDAFKEAVRKLAAGSPQTIIRFNAGSPSVKVIRVTMKLLEDNPAIAFDGLYVEGYSGCSEYTGHVLAQPGDMKFDFDWDCKWKAEQVGWNDAFGDPDQIRAARTFGYQCFRSFVRV